MGDSTGSLHSQPSLFSFVSHHKKASLAVASVFATAGVITTVGVQAQPNNASTHETSVHISSTPEPSEKSSTSSTSQTKTTVQASNASTNHSVHLQVNGQYIPVPASGTTTQTVPTPDNTGQTSVHITSNSDGAAQNSSSSSLNVNIVSNSAGTSSTTSSSTIVTQTEDSTSVTN
jgi:hypothetical protein